MVTSSVPEEEGGPSSAFDGGLGVHATALSIHTLAFTMQESVLLPGEIVQRLRLHLRRRLRDQRTEAGGLVLRKEYSGSTKGQIEG